MVKSVGLRLIDWLPFGRVPDVTPEALASRLEAGDDVRLVDVRTGHEYRAGHIRGAVHVPVQRLPAALAELDLDAHVPVVAICKTAHRSIPAVRLLQSAGFAAVQLAGGMDRWRRQGLPIVEGDQP